MSDYFRLEDERDELEDEKEELLSRLQEIEDRLEEISSLIAKEDNKQLEHEYWQSQF